MSRIGLTAFLAVIATVSPALALPLRASSFADLVAAADVIGEFVVQSKSVEFVDPSAAPLPAASGHFTYVTFKPLNILKGEVGGDALILRFHGFTRSNGTLKGYQGMPTFTLEEHVFLLVRDRPEEDPFCPLIGWQQGKYVVARDELGQMVMRDGYGALLSHFDVQAGSFHRSEPAPPQPGTARFEFGGPVVKRDSGEEAPSEVNEQAPSGPLTRSGFVSILEQLIGNKRAGQ